MDDLQFRRNVYADPSNLDEETRKAINEDASREKFVNELESLDHEIKRALSVDVPENLTQKLILKQTFASHRQQQKNLRASRPSGQAWGPGQACSQHNRIPLKRGRRMSFLLAAAFPSGACPGIGYS